MLLLAVMGAFLISCESAPGPKPMYNGQEYVDLGLSVMWATCNVGATTPEGVYFDLEASTMEQDSKFEERKAIMDAEWGGEWRLPNHHDYQELLTFCDGSLTIKNGVYGYEFTSRINGNKVFFPSLPVPEDIHPMEGAAMGFYIDSEVGKEFELPWGQTCYQRGGFVFSTGGTRLYHAAEEQYSQIYAFEARLVYEAK